MIEIATASFEMLLLLLPTGDTTSPAVNGIVIETLQKILVGAEQMPRRPSAYVWPDGALDKSLPFTVIPVSDEAELEASEKLIE